MKTIKSFENGRSQAVRLPKKLRFSGNEVFVQRLGSVVMLTPREEAWNTFLKGLNSLQMIFLKTDENKNITPKEIHYDLYVRYKYLFLSLLIKIIT